MNITSETKTGTSNRAEEQTFIVLGVLLQFLSTPEQINDQISVMRGTLLSGVQIPLHSHADPEIFYVLNGSIEVFQAEGQSAGLRMPAKSFLSPEMSGTHSEILLLAR
jgi:quercetin dioxygenase-like cupin family protein